MLVISGYFKFVISLNESTILFNKYYYDYFIFYYILFY